MLSSASAIFSSESCCESLVRCSAAAAFFSRLCESSLSIPPISPSSFCISCAACCDCSSESASNFCCFSRLSFSLSAPFFSSSAACETRFCSSEFRSISFFISAARALPPSSSAANFCASCESFSQRVFCSAMSAVSFCAVRSSSLISFLRVSMPALFETLPPVYDPPAFTT